MPRARVCKCSGCDQHPGACGAPTLNGAYCERCSRPGFGSRFGRRVPKNPVYSSRAWRKRSAAEIAAWVAEHGWLCPGWRREAHAVRPGGLALDHRHGLAQGGPALPEAGGTSVLCPSCNTRKALSERARVRRVPGVGHP